MIDEDKLRKQVLKGLAESLQQFVWYAGDPWMKNEHGNDVCRSCGRHKSTGYHESDCEFASVKEMLPLFSEAMEKASQEARMESESQMEEMRLEIKKLNQDVIRLVGERDGLARSLEEAKRLPF